MRHVAFVLVAVFWFGVAAVPAAADVFVTAFGGGGLAVESAGPEEQPLGPESETVTITAPSSGLVRVASPQVLHARGACVAAAGGTHVDCPISEDASVSVNLKFGADTVDASTLTRNIDVSLPDGDDTVATGSGDDGIVVTGSGTQVSAGLGADRLFGDRLFGGAGATVLRGQGGNDTLAGAAHLEGGSGDDTMTGSDAGACMTVSGGDGSDSMTFPQAGRMAISLDGIANDGVIGLSESCNVLGDVEVLRGGYLADVLIGAGGAQQLEGFGGSDEVSGLDGDDTLVGGTGGDTLDGGAADDVFDEGPEVAGGNDNTDILIGGPGNDAADYSARTAAVRVDTDGVADDGTFPLELDDVRPDVEEVRGGSDADELTGNAGSGKLVGGPGDDVLDGGAGADVLLGGLGDADLVRYATRTAGVLVDLDGAAGDDGEPGEGDTVGADVEDIVGGDGDDTLRGNPQDNLLDGGPGADSLAGLGGAGDLADYSYRTAPVEVDLDGESGDDGESGERDTVAADIEDVWGGAGDDVLRGNGAANAVDGGPGDDLLDGDAGRDELDGGAGNDLADYSSRTQRVVIDLDGEPGDDGESGEGDTVGADVESIWSGSGNDDLTGNAHDNLLDGGSGADRLTGLAGFDLVDYFSRTNPVTVDLDGQSGDDGESGEGDTVAGDVEDIWGGSGADRLTGNADQNFLIGAGGDDVLDGGAHADALFGEDGDDQLLTRDGAADADNCGTGSDAVSADEDDVVADDCESVDRDASSPGSVLAPAAPLSSSLLPQASPAGADTTAPDGSSLLPQASPAGADTTAPDATLKAPARIKLARLLTKGVTATLTCSEACTLRAQLRLDRRTAKTLKAPAVAGKGTARLTQAGTVTVVVKLTAKARKGLRRMRSRSLKLVLSVTATDPAQNRRAVTRKLTVAR